MGVPSRWFVRVIPDVEDVGAAAVGSKAARVGVGGVGGFYSECPWAVYCDFVLIVATHPCAGDLLRGGEGWRGVCGLHGVQL